MSGELHLRAEEVKGALWIDGPASSFRDLGAAIDGGWRGSRRLRPVAEPTGSPLSRIDVIEDAADRITLRAANGHVVISGSSSALSLLARNLGNFGSVIKPGSHSHWDYFDQHPLLSADTWPTVLSCDAEADETGGY